MEVVQGAPGGELEGTSGVVSSCGGRYSAALTTALPLTVARAAGQGWRRVRTADGSGPPHVEGFQSVELFAGESGGLAAPFCDPAAQIEGLTVDGARVAAGDVEMLMGAPEDAGGAQTAGEGPAGRAVGPAQEEG